MDNYRSREQMKFGYTTRERASETAALLREVLVSELRSLAEGSLKVADLVEAETDGDDWPPTGVQPSDPWRLPERPDTAAVRALIHAYRRAAELGGPIVAIPIETVLAAKAFAGRWRENTVCVGMEVAWIAGFEKGDWSKESYLHGEVIGIDRGCAAVGGVATNQKSGGWSSPHTQIAVVSVADLRVRPPDWD